MIIIDDIIIIKLKWLLHVRISSKHTGWS